MRGIQIEGRVECALFDSTCQNVIVIAQESTLWPAFFYDSSKSISLPGESNQLGTEQMDISSAGAGISNTNLGNSEVTIRNKFS